MDDDYGSTKIVISQSVTREKIDERIESLKSQLFVLSSEVQSLVLKENPFFTEMAESYIKLKTDDLSDVENWNENSRKMAQLQYDTEVETDENDYNINKEKLDLRAKMLIKYKYEKLIRTVPEYAEYFQRFNLPFFDKISDVPSFPDDDLSDPPISFTKEMLLNANDVNQDLLLLSQPKPKNLQYTVTQKSLKYGKITFQLNSFANVLIPGKQPIATVIQNINKQGISFKIRENGNIFTVSLFALNSGLDRKSVV